MGGQRKLTPEEHAAIAKKYEERAAWQKRVEFERLRKHAPASILEAIANLDKPVAPASATHKSATVRTEKTMSKRLNKRMNASFVNIVKGTDGDLKEFEFTPDGLAMVEPDQDLGRPKPTDATRPKEYPADAFLSGDEGRDAYIGGPTVSGDLRSPVKTPYLLHAPGVIQPDIALVNFLDPTESDVVDEPGMFSPSQPKDQTAVDGVVPPDYDEDDDVSPFTENTRKTVRMGNARILKSQKASFSDIVFGPEKK